MFQDATNRLIRYVCRAVGAADALYVRETLQDCKQAVFGCTGSTYLQLQNCVVHGITSHMIEMAVNT